ncbi:MAG TPA: mechanosensitive ion channel family protein [Streptosporangiaceae bacterium]|nr:mechanosensitive ion channel family protein [Streptosporangiaceae bacterium]
MPPLDGAWGIIPFQERGTPEQYCTPGEPSVACRIAWDISHNPNFTRFFRAWLDQPITKMVWVIVAVVVALVLRRIAHRMIDKVTLRMAEGTMPERLRERTRTIFDGSPVMLNERRKQRAETMGSVLRSIASIVIFGTALFTILGELGLDLAPFLASASIIGVAVGFGAQNIVKDFLAGIFMLLEDQYGVGDVVDIGPATGTVEAVTLRTTRLRDVNGIVWYMRNGEISRVGNQSQNWARAVLDVPVSYDEDVDKVRELLKHASSAMAAEPPWDEIVLAEPDVWGVTALSGEAVVVRIVVKTAPGRQGDVSRELRERVKKEFDKAGVVVATFKEDTSAA